MLWRAVLVSFFLLSCGKDQGGRPQEEPLVETVEVPVSIGDDEPMGSGGVAGGGNEGGAAGAPNEGPTDCSLQEGTRLWWEIKSEVPGHLREGTQTYSWYMPEDVEKRLEGIADKGECSAISCDTHSYISAVNATFLCGYSDWRLPTTEELLGLPDLGEPGDVFDGAEPFYWTSDLHPDDPDVVQGVYLCCGGIDAPAVKFGAGRILLVRDDTLN